MSDNASTQFQHSYGAWTELCDMLGQREFCYMQGLNRLAYQVSIARVQMKWVMQVRHVLAYYNFEKLQSGILLVDEGYRQEAWRLV